MKRPPQPLPKSVEAQVDGRAIPVSVRVNARSRTFRLSVRHSGEAVLTIPPHGRWTDAEAFLQRHGQWLATRVARAPQPIAFAHGSQIALRGEPHRIVATGQVRGQVSLSEDDKGPTLLVPGLPPHLPRRLVDWLKAEARRDLLARCAVHAANLGVTYKGLTLKDQSSRWGSCSSAGNLNFNWRLVLAPPYVLDYVAAHEVAHLVHMDHSPAFWATVQRALPSFERGQAWLKAHGSGLMVYGREP